MKGTVNVRHAVCAPTPPEGAVWPRWSTIRGHAALAQPGPKPEAMRKGSQTSALMCACQPPPPLEGAAWPRCSAG